MRLIKNSVQRWTQGRAEAIATRLEAIASRLEATPIRWTHGRAVARVRLQVENTRFSKMVCWDLSTSSRHQLYSTSESYEALDPMNLRTLSQKKTTLQMQVYIYIYMSILIDAIVLYFVCNARREGRGTGMCPGTFTQFDLHLKEGAANVDADQARRERGLFG